jgi:hypothetical protein
VSASLEGARSILRAAGIPTVELVRDQNLGCKSAVERAITWFFNHESEGVILEDDCQPSQAFFAFYDLMLERVRDDTRVMHISGYSEDGAASLDFRFSRFPAVWGWAPWARAWPHYPAQLPQIDKARLRRIAPAFASRTQLDYFAAKWDAVRRGELDTWDFTWVYAVRSQNGLAMHPTGNLIPNVGMGDPRAAQTTRPDERIADNLAANPPVAALTGPPVFLPDDRLDQAFFRDRMVGRLGRVRALARRLMVYLNARVTS